MLRPDLPHRPCPTGVTTQDPIRERALVVPEKGQRVFNFHRSTLIALKDLVQAAGLQHPQEITAHHIVRRISDTEVRQLSNLILHVEPGSLITGSLEDQHNVFKVYWPMAKAERFAVVKCVVPAWPGIHTQRIQYRIKKRASPRASSMRRRTFS